MKENKSIASTKLGTDNQRPVSSGNKKKKRYKDVVVDLGDGYYFLDWADEELDTDDAN